jgi:hypothetical protein
MFGISPPPVSEYLYSANYNLLVQLVADENEADNFVAEPDGNRMYYHVINN